MDCAVCRGACCETFTAEIYMHPPMADAQRWLELHATVENFGTKLTFECRCTKLTSEGRCGIWDDRPMVCELFIAGGRQCLDTVKARRTPAQYQLIRGADDPLTIQEGAMRRLIVKIHDKNGEWTETYDEGKSGSFNGTDADLKKWAEDLVSAFNRRLRAGETERFVDSITVEEVPVADEDEEKDDPEGEEIDEDLEDDEVDEADDEDEDDDDADEGGEEV